MRMVKMGVMMPLVGMKPEKMPCTEGMMFLMGVQGLEKAAWTTEWFCGMLVSAEEQRGRVGRRSGDRK